MKAIEMAGPFEDLSLLLFYFLLHLCTKTLACSNAQCDVVHPVMWFTL